ncbi:MAG: UvrD-helicase domain-containing protein [Byssovorax sp.]
MPLAPQSPAPEAIAIAPRDRVLPDAEARRRIREDLGATLIVEAAAGTGKTTALVGRIVAVLRAGATELDRIAAVTFTEKAAGEMKLRLRAGLEKARTAADLPPIERDRLDRALAHLEVCRIGTIHALCADLLRERPVEARVDPLFEVAAEDEAERLFEHTFEAWFQEALQRPPEGVRRALRRRPRHNGSGPRELLRDAAYKLAGHRDFPTPYRRDPFDRDAAIDAVVTRLRALAPFASRAERSGDFLAESLKKIERFLAELDRREQIRPRDHDGLEAELNEIGRWREWTWKGGGARYAEGLLRADVLAERDAVKADLDRLLEACSADLAACLHRELWPLIDRYAERKARAGKLDFLDLLLATRDLVKGSRAVREELQARFSHLFVDEFQDTDPLQAEILLLLAADDPEETDYLRARPVPGKLFLVGDPKQSIYRFRRADVALYEQIKTRLSSLGASVLDLSTSFRSSPALQDLVNAAFAPVMTGPTPEADPRPGVRSMQARYVALEKHRPSIPGQPAVIALPVPRPYAEWGKVTDRAIDASLPDAVGAFLDWLIRESGWTVTERDGDGGRAPLQARHICLLFKRFQSFGDDSTRAYVRALEARRIPHVLVGGKSFHDREEVLAVRNALSAIEWPEDELRVYATLRGPFFALPDEALLAYRAATGDGISLGLLNPLRHTGELWLRREDTAPVAAALGVLRRLHLGRNRRPIADTIARLLDETRAHAGIAIWPTGEQALANVLRVMDLARRFEAAGTTSFRAFVERLDGDALAGQAGEAPVVEEGTEGVRIMTVHRAKGLELPVVVLADPTAKASFGQPTLHVDQAKGLWAEALGGHLPIELVERREEVRARDREENTRLAYVAATRARDLLVVPVVGDQEIDGWLSVLGPTLHPPRDARRRPLPAPGCPPFGTDSVLERPLRTERDERDAVAPGEHRPRAGDHRVVWWDPAILDLDRQPEGGLRQQRILAADERGVVSEEGKLAHAAWAERRSALLEAGSTPTLPVLTATEIAEQEELEAPMIGELDLDPDAPAEEHAVAVEDTGVDRQRRPRGKRFGTLVHAVLAEVDLDAGREAVSAVARAQGRLFGASPEEVESASLAVAAALAHPLLRRAAESARRGDCRRETPVLLPLPGGAVVEGVIDLAFREPVEGGFAWTVVDFKTDVELLGRKGKYQTQVLLYVRAIAEATGESAQGALLSV